LISDTFRDKLPHPSRDMRIAIARFPCCWQSLSKPFDGPDQRYGACTLACMMSDHAMARRPDDTAIDPPSSSAPISAESSEGGPIFSSVAESISSGFENAESAMDFVKNSPHLSTGVKTFSGINSGLLSMVSSGLEATEAADDFKEGDTAKGVGEATKAGAGVVGGGAKFYQTAMENYAKLGASEAGKEFFEHQANGAQAVGNAAGGVAGVANGVMDISDGYHQIVNNKKVDAQAQGANTLTKGAVETGGGLAQGILAWTGAPSVGLADALPAIADAGSLATWAAPAAGAFATGMEIGHYGDEQAKKLGIFKDRKGNAETASDWAAEKGVAADEWVTENLHSKTLGTIAGASLRPDSRASSAQRGRSLAQLVVQQRASATRPISCGTGSSR
jgi:hypothetical protein